MEVFFVIAGVVLVGLAAYWWVWPALGGIAAWVAALSFGWLFTVFAIGTGWFWFLLALESVLMCFVFLDESDPDEPIGFGATISIVVTILLLSLLGDFASFVWLNKLLIGGWVLGFLALGVAHVYFRVGMFTKEADDAIADLVRTFCREQNITQEQLERNPEKREALKKYIWELSRYRKSPARRINQNDGKVWISDHKARVMVWLMYWPWSFAWYALHDLVAKIGERIYRLMLGSLQRLSDHNTKTSQKYFSKEPPADSTPPTNGGADLKSEADALVERNFGK